METTGDRPQSPVSQVSELMQSLTLGIVGDLGRLLKEQGLGEKPIKIVEALVFAMFVATETFTSAKKGLGGGPERPGPVSRGHDRIYFQGIFL